MRKKISVLGEGVQLGEVLSPWVDSSGDLHGADLVVLTTDDADLDKVRHHAPAAVVLVAGDDAAQRCKRVYDATFFPRARIVGIKDPDDFEGVAESIVFERGAEHRVLAMADGEFGERRVLLGRGGIRELL
jgi:hypothetical protein